MKHQPFANLNFINIICPINEQAAPDHNTENSKIDPVSPSDNERMLVNYFFHDATKILLVSNEIIVGFVVE